MKPQNNSPFLSIVIPSQFHRESLKGLLESICLQTLSPSRYEVIVVFNGLEKSGIEKWQAEHSNVEFYFLEWPGANGARNFGARNARGKYLMFLDDDCRLTNPHQLADIMKTLLQTQAESMAGEYRTPVCGSLVQKVYNVISNSWLDLYSANTVYSEVFLGGAFVIKSEVFASKNGFEERVQGGGEEWSLSQKLNPFSILRESKLDVYHQFQGGWRRFFVKPFVHKPKKGFVPPPKSWKEKVSVSYKKLTTEPSLHSPIQLVLTSIGFLAFFTLTLAVEFRQQMDGVR